MKRFLVGLAAALALALGARQLKAADFVDPGAVSFTANTGSQTAPFRQTIWLRGSDGLLHEVFSDGGGNIGITTQPGISITTNPGSSAAAQSVSMIAGSNTAANPVYVSGSAVVYDQAANLSANILAINTAIAAIKNGLVVLGQVYGNNGGVSQPVAELSIGPTNGLAQVIIGGNNTAANPVYVSGSAVAYDPDANLRANISAHNAAFSATKNGVEVNANLNGLGGVAFTSVGNTNALALTTSTGNMPVVNYNQLFQGSTLGWGPAFTPDIFKPQVNVTVGTTAVTLWTPASGKKFRLLGYNLGTNVTGTYTFFDSAGTTITSAFLPASATATTVLLGNGYPGASQNNTLTATGPAGGLLTGILFGTEHP